MRNYFGDTVQGIAVTVFRAPHIEFSLQLQLIVSLTSILQLQEIISLRDFQEFFTIAVTTQCHMRNYFGDTVQGIAVTVFRAPHIEFSLQLQLIVSLTSILQLQEIISLRDFQEFLTIAVATDIKHNVMF